MHKEDLVVDMDAAKSCAAAARFLRNAREAFDELQGAGAAARQPHLLAAFMLTAAMHFHADKIERALHDAVLELQEGLDK